MTVITVMTVGCGDTPTQPAEREDPAASAPASSVPAEVLAPLQARLEQALAENAKRSCPRPVLRGQLLLIGDWGPIPSPA